MKIIRPGNVAVQAVTFECRRCNCMFEATVELEARRVTDQRDGDYWQSKCPTCNTSCTKSVCQPPRKP